MQPSSSPINPFWSTPYYCAWALFSGNLELFKCVCEGACNCLLVCVYEIAPTGVCVCVHVPNRNNPTEMKRRETNFVRAWHVFRNCVWVFVCAQQKHSTEFEHININPSKRCGGSRTSLVLHPVACCSVFLIGGGGFKVWEFGSR